MSIEMVVLDPASLLVHRKAKQRKTGRIDAKKTVRALLAHDRGDAAVLSRVLVPSVEEEDRKRLIRERRRLVKERNSLANSIKGLLKLHGIFDQAPRAKDFEEKFADVVTDRVRLTAPAAGRTRARTGRGSPSPRFGHTVAVRAPAPGTNTRPHPPCASPRPRTARWPGRAPPRSTPSIRARIVRRDDLELLLRQHAEQQESRHRGGERRPWQPPGQAALGLRPPREVPRVGGDRLLHALRRGLPGLAVLLARTVDLLRCGAALLALLLQRAGDPRELADSGLERVAVAPAAASIRPQTWRSRSRISPSVGSPPAPALPPAGSCRGPA